MESGVKRHASDRSSDHGLPPMEARTETKIDNFFDKRKSMSTITLKNVRACSDITMKVRLKDNGVAVDWSGLTDIKALVYSDVQKAVAGRCAVSVDSEDHTVLVCLYAATKPQYLGVNSIVVRAKYMGREKTYDKQAVNIVARTAELEGEQVVLEDPEVTVDIEVTEVDSSILDNAIAAAFDAADRAEAAAAAAEQMVDIHTGPAGKSAYEVAVDEGYTGTEEQWLASLKGETGDTPDISIGTVTTVEPGEPAAASMSGTPEAPVLNLSIPKGLVGATPNITVGTVTTGEPGTPVVVTITGTPEAPVLNVTIPQGMQGNTGSSVDYPYELVNNLTTNDATKGLSAAQGVVLDGKISQLGQRVGFKLNNFIIDGYLDTSGVVQDSNVWKTTDFLDVNLFSVSSLLLSGLSNGVVGAVCFYNEDKTFISCINNNIINNDNFVIPSGTRYIRFSKDSRESSHFVSINSGIIDLKDYAKPEQLKDLTDNALSVNFSYLLTIGAYIDSNYISADSPVWVCSDYIPIEQMYGKIKYSCISFNYYGINIANVSFYDESKNGIGYVGGQTSNVRITGEVDIPSGTKYVRFCNKAEDVSNGLSIFLAILMQQAVYEKVFKEENPKNVYVVDKEGNGDFTSLTAAVNGISNDSVENPVTIIVNPGVYKEHVDILPDRYLSLVGVNRDTCILRWDTGKYCDEPLRFDGNGLVQNMTIISTYDDIEDPVPQNLFAYAVHIDKSGSINTKQVLINCVMSSNGSAAIGIGLHQGQEVNLINCEMYSNTPATSTHRINGAVLFHSQNAAGITGQKVLMKNCIAHSKNGKAISVTDNNQTDTAGQMNVTFIDNVVYCENINIGDNSPINITTPSEGHFSGKEIDKTPLCYGNNIQELN